MSYSLPVLIGAPCVIMRGVPTVFTPEPSSTPAEEGCPAGMSGRRRDAPVRKEDPGIRRAGACSPVVRILAILFEMT